MNDGMQDMEQSDDERSAERDDSGDDSGKESGDHEEWIMLGQAPDRLTADFIIETLRSYDIPAVVDSKSGFLGDTGLTALSSVFSSPTGAYAVMVPVSKAEEALGIAEMVGGERWEPTKG